MKLQMTGLNTYAGIWTFGILVCFILFGVLFLLFGFNWIS